MSKIKEIYSKYNEIINYIWVGLLTTVVSWTAKFVAAIWLDADIPFQNTVLALINWTAGVIFGYFANRAWVFKSKNPHMLAEFGKFAGSRVITYFMDLAINIIGINVLAENFFYPTHPGDNIAFSLFGMDITYSKTVLVCVTLISAVIVTISNYIFSKLIVFRKKKPAQEPAEPTKQQDEL